jgi:FG-GAP-like repeat
VSDVRAGDLDGDGDLDLAVAQFGYDQGETRWMENQGGWKFASHPLQSLSGPINAEIADADGDGDLDIVTLVSQEWEEIYVFENDGRGRFTARRIFGASNEDFGSSWISLADLDKDGDADVVYSNGDAFDYAPPTGRGWNGVQWLENRGGLTFRYHRIGDFPGASSPQAADMDGDGDIDVVVVSAYNDWDRLDALSLAWFENDGTMTFTLRPITGTPTHLITLAIADLDGNRKPDLVTGGMHMSYPFDRMSRVTVWLHR